MMGGLTVTIELPFWGIFVLGLLTALCLPLAMVGAVLIWDAWQMARMRAKLVASQKEMEAITKSLREVEDANIKAAVSSLRLGRDPRHN
jgi:uncharacterized membrane protein (DUF106 family)